MSERSILAIEMCLRLEPQVQDFLRNLLARLAPSQSFQDKWVLFDQAARCLVHNRGLWVSGCWDFFDDDMKARGDFNMWVQGMLTEEGARKAPAGPPDAYRGEMRHMTFTMACLMVQGSPSEQALKHACAIPESRLWSADSFEHVLRSLRHINFASVEASTMYLIPNDIGWGLTTEDLKHPKFHYLRPLI